MVVRSLYKRGRLVLLVAAAAALSAAFSAGPAAAGLGIQCPDPSSQPFQSWDDNSFYAFAPDGGLENGGSGWTLSGGARVVDGNESFFVHAGSDDSALALPSGSSATTPPMCIGLLSGHMRFFLANGGSSGSKLKVQVLYGGGLGGLLSTAGRILGVSDLGYLKAGSSWQPSAEVEMLGGTAPLLTQYVQFRFTPADGTGAWRIDDVYLDPLLHC
jgi:hypothetical protein